MDNVSNNVIEKVSNALGYSWSALVHQQIWNGILFLLVGLVVAFVIYLLWYKFNLKLTTSNVIITYVLLGVLCVSLSIYGLAHIVNPSYFALQEAKTLISK